MVSVFVYIFVYLLYGACVCASVCTVGIPTGTFTYIELTIENAFEANDEMFNPDMYSQCMN